MPARRAASPSDFSASNRSGPETGAREVVVHPSTHGCDSPSGRHGPSRLHPLVAAACGALDAGGLSWALLRGEDELVDPGSDVDVLVGGPGDLPAVARALRPLGIVAVPRLGAGAHRHFVGYHRPTRRWIELDVEWDLDFGPHRHFLLNWLAPALRTGATRAVLARRCRSPRLPGLWVLHPDDGFWALLLHVIVDKAVMAERHARALVELCDHATPSSPLAEVITAACPGGWDAERVIRHAQAEDWPGLLELGRVLAREASAGHSVAHRARALGRGLHRLGLDLGPVLMARGLRVAVLGPDDVGRSAIAAGLVSGQPFPARVVPMKPSRRRTDAPGPRWRRHLLVPYHHLLGRTVVFDGDGGPRPDVVIVLDPPDSTTSPGRPDDEVEKVAPSQWADGPPGGHPPTYVVRVDRSQDEVLADATAIVWTARAQLTAGAERPGGSSSH